jgi:hypothetical protein
VSQDRPIARRTASALCVPLAVVTAGAEEKLPQRAST